MPTGYPKQQTYKSKITITGTDSLTDTMIPICKNNFPNFNFDYEDSGLLCCDFDNGETEFLQRGYVHINAIINAHALQASTEFQALLEIYNNSQWVKAPLRKSVIISIYPTQQVISGIVYVEKGYKIRMCAKKSNGNMDIITEIIDGEIIPAAIIYITLHTRI